MAKQSHKGARPRLRVDGRLARARGGTDAPRRPMLPEPLARFVRFAGTSFVCTVFDQVLAGFLFVVLRRPLAGRGFLRILVASVVARIFSQALNYALNHRLVFSNIGEEEQRPSGRQTLPRFLATATLVLTLSTVGVYLLNAFLHVQESLAKVAMDSLLFFLNYYLQHNWVFAAEPSIDPRKAGRGRRR